MIIVRLLNRFAYALLDAAPVIGTGVAVAIHRSRYWMPTALDGRQTEVYIALSAVAATLLGFILAAITILLTIGGRRLTLRFLSSDLYGKTLGLFHATGVWLAVATAYCLAGLFIDPSKRASDGPLPTTSLWVWGVVALAGVAAWRFFYSLWILKNVMDLAVADRRGNSASAAERPSDDEMTYAG